MLEPVGQDAAAQASQPRTRSARALDNLRDLTLRESPYDGDEMVRDPHSGRLVEAPLAATPPERRSAWAERMRAKGCSPETIAALGGAR